MKSGRYSLTIKAEDSYEGVLVKRPERPVCTGITAQVRRLPCDIKHWKTKKKQAISIV